MRERRAALVRLLLGVLQMTAAAVGFGYLAVEGPSPRALAAALVGLVFTSISLLLFRGRRS